MLTSLCRACRKGGTAGARSVLASSRMNASRGNRRTIHKMISTAPRSTVGTDRCSAVTRTLPRHDCCTAVPIVAVTGYVLDLAVWIHDKRHEKAPDSVKSWGIFVRLSPE